MASVFHVQIFMCVLGHICPIYKSKIKDQQMLNMGVWCVSSSD